MTACGASGTRGDKLEAEKAELVRMERSERVIDSLVNWRVTQSYRKARGMKMKKQ